MPQVDGKDPARLRVHAGAAGFGGLGALIEPLRLEPVDVFLLVENPDDRAREWFQKRGVNVVEELRRVVPRVETLTCDLWDPMSAGNLLVRTMQDAGYESISINVSTGPNNVGIGAALASLFWNLRLYFSVSDFAAPMVSETHGFPFKGVSWLPTFHSEALRPQVLAALEILAARPEGLSSARFKRALKDGRTPVIKPRDGRKDRPIKPQAVHGQFLTITKHLLAWHLAVEEDRFGPKHYRITEEGQGILRLFRGVADAR